jgi:membrane protease YdiL (CAAX protease family)
MEFAARALEWSAGLNHVPLMGFTFAILWLSFSAISSLAAVMNRPGWERLSLYLLDPLSKWVVFGFGLALYLFTVAWPQGQGIAEVARGLGLSMDVDATMIVQASAALLLVWLAIAVAFYALARLAGARLSRKASILQPQTPAEMGAFLFILSPTAGILEEIVFRGALLALFTGWQGGDVWAAALTTSILFGLGHAYQGLGGILATGIMGWTAAVSVILTGSLWPAIIAHTIYDMATVIIYRRAPDPWPWSEYFDLRKAERPF